MNFNESHLQLLKKQKDIVNLAINSQLSEGDKWYLLDNRWYTQWNKYVDQEDPSALESSNPGPIDNSGIIDQKSGMLKEHLLEHNDYQIINEEGWSILKNCYGLMSNQEPICRKVVQIGLYMKENKLEVYLIELNLCCFNDMDNIVLKSFTKVATIADVLREAKKLLHIPEEIETRVWSKLMQNTYEIITRMESTLQDSAITSGQMLVLELKNKNGEWTRQTRNRSFFGSTSTITSDQASRSFFGSTSTIYQESPIEVRKAEQTLEELHTRLAQAETARDNAQMQNKNLEANFKVLQTRWENEKNALTYNLNDSNKKLECMKNELDEMERSKLLLLEELNTLKKYFMINRENEVSKEMSNAAKITLLEEKIDIKEEEIQSLLTASEESSREVTNKLRDMLGVQQKLASEWREESQAVCLKFEEQVAHLRKLNDDMTCRNHELLRMYQESLQKTNQITSDKASRSLPGSTSTITSNQAPSISSNYNSYMSFAETQHRATKPGLCGLANIGNTCFMNTALQCLSNTTPLTKYFLSNTYKHEINPNNPLGMQGKIAETYAELLHNVWGSNTYFTPRNFKMQVERFAPKFSSSQEKQQDSHEFLAFLLDGLHKDLNRVKQKPYIKLANYNSRPDKICAEEAWSNPTLRNSSIIVDLFHGLFISTVQCPVCQKKSMTFDPFCYLSLPLPIKKERNLGIKFIPLDTSKTPIKVKVTVPKLGNIFDLTTTVGRLTSTDPSKLMVTDVFSSKFHKIYEPHENLSQITDKDDIIIYEVPFNLSTSKDQELLILPVYFRNIRETSYTYAYGYSNPLLFGTPILVSVPKNLLSARDLYKVILRAMRRYVKVPVNIEPISTEVSASNEEPVCIKEISTNIDVVPVSNTDDQKNEDMSDDQCDEPKIKKDSFEKESFMEENQINKLDDVASDYLFQICVVNMAGSQNILQLSYDDCKPVNLNSRTYLAIDCSPQFKKYYSEKLAQETEEHDSCNAGCPPKKTVNLNDCLDLFLQEEKLGEDDPWYCPQCKEHRQAVKKFDLWTLPKVLVIHLKRFSYNRYWRDKIDALVDFPIKQLDLTDYVINKNHPRAVYDLHAVSNHFAGLGGGHYTAYGVNCCDGQWYYFDDASVTSANTESVVSKAAYVLFYTRRDDPDTEIMNTSELLTEDIDDERMESS